MITYVFAYGSLLDPDSLRHTLPSADIRRSIPAKLTGYTRLWNVAFPNEGSQTDKAYYDEENQRPPVILFSNLGEVSCGGSSEAVNGLLLPVEEDQLARLRERELRYLTVDVTERIEAYAAAGGQLTKGEYAAVAFVGKEAFTREDDVRRGVIPKSYIDMIYRGVAFWDERVSGFERDFLASTKSPDANDVAELRRVDT